VIAPARPPIRVLSSQVTRKRGRRGALAINPQTAARLRAYLDRAGNADDVHGPCFGPLKHNGKQREEHRRVDWDAIDCVVRKQNSGRGSHPGQ